LALVAAPQRPDGDVTLFGMDELLATIARAPDDDVPRFVLANQLEEHGDKWGELIVTSCELAAYTREGRRWDARAVELVDRCHALQRERFPQDKIQCVFERGFCKRIFLFGGDLAQLEGPAFALIDEVDAFAATVPMLLALAAWPRLASVSKLKVRVRDGANTGFATLDVIARAARATHVALAGGELDSSDLRSILARRPELRGVACSRLGLSQQLADMPWPDLETLDLSACQLTAPDVDALLASEKLHDLQTLNLGFNRLDAAAAATIARGPFSRLTHLELGGNKLGVAGIEQLAASPTLAGLTALQIGGNDEDLAGALPLFAAAFPRLDTLALKLERPVRGLSEIARSYRELDLHLVSPDLDDLATLLAHPALRSLHRLRLKLESSEIGEPLSGEPLGAAIAAARLPGLANLVLDCRLDEDAACALARAEHLPHDLQLTLDDPIELGIGRSQLQARFPLSFL
ncbi:MAG TPA: hypothetical protein VGC41_10290, partial [Kofleriaceae bacterium]